jgi:hypothetical protein
MPDAAPHVMPAAVSPEAAAIDAVVAAFYALFDNRRGLSPLLDAPKRLYLDDALIVRRDGHALDAMSLDAFLAPRRRWLADGTLVDFHERETDARTAIAGGLATRRSRYRKSGFRDGVAVDGEGTKALQLVRTADGWRIASVLWEDGAGLDWQDAAR